MLYKTKQAATVLAVTGRIPAVHVNNIEYINCGHALVCPQQKVPFPTEGSDPGPI